MGAIDWRGWNITDEQAERIRRGDLDACTRFYLDNLKRIKKMAYGYASKHRGLYSWVDDMVQGVYTDLAVFQCAYNRPVVDGIGLSRFVYWSFFYARFGGLAYLRERNPKILCGGEGMKEYNPRLRSLDEPLGVGHNRHKDDENKQTLADIVAAPAVEIDEKHDFSDECKEIAARFLSPRESECCAYMIDGYTFRAIGDAMHIKGDGAGGYMFRVKQKLRKNAAAVLSALSACGVDVDEYEGKTPPDENAPRVYKLSPEKRARAAELARKRRAAKKGVPPDLPPAA